MSRKLIPVPGGAIAAPPRHKAASGGHPALFYPRGAPATVLGLARAPLPPGSAEQRRLAWSRGLSDEAATLLAAIASHPRCTVAAGYYAVKSRLGTPGHGAAYRQLVDAHLVIVDSGSWQGRYEITPAGAAALARWRIEAWNAAYDMAAWDYSFQHKVNALERGALACAIGMGLLGMDYIQDVDREACLMTAWEVMGPAVRRYLAQAGLPLLMGLLNVVAWGPLPLVHVAADIRQWAAWCAKPADVRKTKWAVERIDRAARLGLVQMTSDPRFPAGQGPLDWVGRGGGWSLPVSDAASRSGLQLVEG